MRNPLQDAIDAAERDARARAAQRTDFGHMPKIVGRMNVSAAAAATRDGILRDLNQFGLTNKHILLTKLAGLRDGSGGTNIAMVTNTHNDKCVVVKCDGKGLANMSASEAIHAVR